MFFSTTRETRLLSAHGLTTAFVFKFTHSCCDEGRVKLWRPVASRLGNRLKLQGTLYAHDCAVNRHARLQHVKTSIHHLSGVDKW